MESTLATILGTAALGLLKGRFGSSIRLSTKEISLLFSENRFLVYYDGTPFEKDVVIKSSVPQISDVILNFVFNEEGQTAHDLVIIFNERYTENEIYQIIEDNAYTIMMEAWDAFETIYENSGENPGWSYLYTDNALQYRINQKSVLIQDLEDPLMNNSLLFSNSFPDRTKIIINVETGERYKKSEPPVPKLRRR